jgi:hypothetical protein
MAMMHIKLKWKMRQTKCTTLKVTHLSRIMTDKSFPSFCKIALLKKKKHFWKRRAKIRFQSCIEIEIFQRVHALARVLLDRRLSGLSDDDNSREGHIFRSFRGKEENSNGESEHSIPNVLACPI